MKTFAAALFILLVPLAAQAEHYGAPIEATEPVSLAQAIADENRQQGAVLVEAKVGSVCTAKGCWLGLAGEAGDIRVTFKDYGFFVPFNIVGKTVWVEGELSRKQLSLAETKHYVADAGGDPAAVTEAAVEYTMVASGVEVRN